VGAGIFVREATRTEKIFQPARPPALRSGFGPTQEIAFRHDADEATFPVDHGQPADVPLQHDARGLRHGIVRPHRDDRRRHHISSLHARDSNCCPEIILAHGSLVPLIRIKEP
jgi:hypothetical protein